jgi:putative copper export protein
MELLTVARWLGYLGVMGLVGSATFQGIVQLRVAHQYPGARNQLLGRVRAVAFLAALFLVLAMALKLLGQLKSFVDPGEAVTREIFDIVVFESGWGHGWQIQSVVAAVTLLLVLLVRNTWTLVPLAIASAAVAPLTGHAVESPWGTDISFLVHTVHQLGGGMWIGTLFLVVAAGYGGTRGIPDDERHPLIATLVHAYSPVALAGVSTAIIAGIVLALSYLDPISALWTSSYGRVLILKTCLLGSTAAIGAYNWRVVRPRLGEKTSSGKLYRSATLELIVGGLLLGATAILVALPAPGME